MKKQLTLALLTSLTLFQPAFAGDVEAGKAAYAICASCHGANGEGNVALNAPALAGQETWYVERQLKNFKEGIRGKHEKDVYGMQMAPMAMTLADDAAITNVAAYIATFKAEKPAATIKGDAEKGKAAYAVCLSCHGANGEGMQAVNAPRLNAQADWYLVRQLANFKGGIRGADPKDVYGMQMAPMSMTLADDAAINDVVAYINTLK